MEILLPCNCCGAAVRPEDPAFRGLLINMRRSLTGERVLLQEQMARVVSGKKKDWVVALSTIQCRLQEVELLLTTLPEEK